MALTYGFYNSVEGDRKYDAIQMGQIFDGIITDGVYATFLKAMVVKASDNPSEVIVQPGRCWFNHTWTYIDADYPVEAPTPEVILDRVDALVLDINSENAFRANSLVWVQGTPSSLNPERPTLIKSVTHNQYPLCYVYRKAGTTMIYAADITNAVGTSETPFVTGVLQGINIDDLLAQWDDEFHTWEDATKTSFEAWMVNQQSVYVTWFDSIKDQMEGDLTDFEAWFETIRGIIDEEAATHLQAEIDALSEMLPAGSHIDVSTTESTLFNRNVTVSDGVHSKTVQFDASGAATVESFPYIGIISVTSTDGTRTAEESINIPYFGRYSATLAFWSATVNLVGDESLAAIPVTVRDSNGDVVAIVTLNAYGQGVFTATKPDTYKFIYTYGGQTMEVSLAVTQETTYEVEIHGGFNFSQWLTAGRVSESFSSLDDILEDEPTLRQLMLVHDSVDYICDTFSNGSAADVTKIFNTDLAAKWINLSDYALDHFYAVSGIKSIMDTADKYGYGEWVLMPQVPKMTSNTAPYGTASATTTYAASSGYEAYRAFDGLDSTRWNAGINQRTNQRLQYQFLNPVKIVEVGIIPAVASGGRVKDFIVQGSNDGTTWVDIDNFTCVESQTLQRFNFANENEYSYYAVYVLNCYATATDTAIAITELNFYAWAPKGNVPVMTSDTTPYGTSSADSVYNTDSPAWKAFSKLDSQWHSTNSSATHFLMYKSVSPICVKRFDYTTRNFSAERVPRSLTLQGSNDGSTFTNIITVTPSQTVGDTKKQTFYCEENTAYYLYLKLVMTLSAANYTDCSDLQFYGRELKVSVPIMTSNTAPYGTVAASSAYSGYSAWAAFDGTNSNASDCWHSNATSGEQWISYSFVKPVCVRSAYMEDRNGTTSGTYTVKIQGSNDNTTWTDITEFTYTASTAGKHAIDMTTNNNFYFIYRLDYPTTSSYVTTGRLQFYGLDYSEKEFEVGTTKKWLYDHGVELVELDYTSFKASASTLENDGTQLVLSGSYSANQGRDLQTNQKIDAANYNLVMAKLGNRFITINGVDNMEVSSNKVTSYNDMGNYRLSNTSIILPTNDLIKSSNISSINQEAIFGLGSRGTSSVTITTTISEWWLE